MSFMPKAAARLTKFNYQSMDDKGVLLFIDTVRKGISSKYFFSEVVKTFNFDISFWANFLQLSERSLQRYEKENKVFDRDQSEKILELTMLHNYGIEVFGNEENFNKWLEFKNLALGGIKPVDLLDTRSGITLIKDELTRIEHGVLA
jgi:putative toxin-antitoxin system antitoxin component (TIGR02293 family)